MIGGLYIAERVDKAKLQASANTLHLHTSETTSLSHDRPPTSREKTEGDTCTCKASLDQKMATYSLREGRNANEILVVALNEVHIQ